MVKSPKLEETLEKLSQLQNHPKSQEAIAVLSEVLKSKYAVAVARATKIICKAEMKHLCPELEIAFNKFLLNSEVSDPACIAKKAIADALYRMEYSGESLFLKGIHHIQMEPVWGGKIDTAPGLRGLCALGLVRINYPDAMLELADLLADPEPEARIGAARAIAYSENPQGVPLLRLRVKMGDSDAQVLSEYFISLLKLAPEHSLPLVASFLNNPEEQICEMAALSLGESGITEAFPILSEWWQHTRSPELRQTGLLAIAMLRHDDALAFLLLQVTEGKLSDAQAAISALRIYPEDSPLWQQVRQIVGQREDFS
jgi:HEAT repeat protein